MKVLTGISLFDDHGFSRLINSHHPETDSGKFRGDVSSIEPTSTAKIESAPMLSITETYKETSVNTRADVIGTREKSLTGRLSM